MKRLPFVLLLFAATLSAQPGTTTRRATNIPALLAHSEFFHMRPVVVVGELKLLDSGEIRLTTDGASLRVVNKGNTPEGSVEVRGEYWDLGKFTADDPRLVGFDLRRTFGIDAEGGWPRLGQVTALVASSIAPAAPPSAPSIRNIVLNPSRYLDQKVTVTGQFGGRNLLGDLPDAPGQSRWDFVIRSADAAVWVTNLRPRGKDFELSLDARIDTGRWVEVAGTLQQGRGLQWLNAEGGTIKITQAPKDTPEMSVIRVAAAPPPTVIFSTPIAGEDDVLPTSGVRIQFSRDMDPATFKGHIRARYTTGSGAPLEFTTQYLPGTRVLELKFAAPLERFSGVTIELQEGIIGSDKQPLAPWALTFGTGG
jgi:Bacterial Ig-like domain